MKAIITLLFLIVNTCVLSQTTETRTYNGKYTKETALKKINEYLKIVQSENLKFVGGESSPYQIDGIWEQKLTGKDKITVGIRYVIEDKSISIMIISAVVAKGGDFIMLSPQSTDEANRKAYNNQVKLFAEVPFNFMTINQNIVNTQNNSSAANVNTINTKKLKDYSSEEAKFFMKKWKELNGNNLKDKMLATYLHNRFGSWDIIGYSSEEISHICANMFNEMYGIEKSAAYDLILNFPESWKTNERLKSVISKLNKDQQLYIKNTATAKKTDSNSIPANSYSDMSTEAKSYLEEYRKTPNDLKNYLKNRQSNWEQKGNSPEAIVQICVNMFKEIYAEDKDASFELMMKLPRNIDVKKILPMLTEDERKFIREKSKQRLQKYSGSYSTKTN